MRGRSCNAKYWRAFLIKAVGVLVIFFYINAVLPKMASKNGKFWTVLVYQFNHVISSLFIIDTIAFFFYSCCAMSQLNLRQRKHTMFTIYLDVVLHEFLFLIDSISHRSRIVTRLFCRLTFWLHDVPVYQDIN